jgi:hypothetical protein
VTVAADPGLAETIAAARARYPLNAIRQQYGD